LADLCLVGSNVYHDDDDDDDTYDVCIHSRVDELGLHIDLEF